MKLSVLACFCVYFFCLTTFAQFSAQEIVNKTIEAAGGERYNNNTSIYFSFRGKKYQSKRKKGHYQLERLIENTQGTIHDIVSNTGLKRMVDNCPVAVADSLVTKISDGVNSVHYFANLPFGLNAPAVQKELVGESNLGENRYYKVKVTFKKEGGGTDFEDEFLYWIHKENFTVDFLAYKYAVHGGGIRFREAYNPRVINGIRFVDYKNYKTDDLSTSLDELDKVYEQQGLKLLSKIELKEIFVQVDVCC